MQGRKSQDWKTLHQTAGLENAGNGMYGKPNGVLHNPFSRFPVPRFPILQFGLAFYSLAVWCHVFQSRVFQSRVFSSPTHLPTPEGLKAELALGGWLHTEINVRHRELNPDTVTHRSTNQARRRLTSLIETDALPLC